MAKALIPTRIVQRVRGINNRAMPDTATILRRSQMADSTGAQAASYSDTGLTVACRIAPERKRNDRQEGGRVAQTDLYIASFPHDADILETDRIHVSAMPGVTFEIVGPVGELSYNVGRRLRLKRV